MELFFVAVQIVVPPVFVLFRVIRISAVHVQRIGDIGKIGNEKGAALQRLIIADDDFVSVNAIDKGHLVIGRRGGISRNLC